jgi:hypothetical protein
MIQLEAERDDLNLPSAELDVRPTETLNTPGT